MSSRFWVPSIFGARTASKSLQHMSTKIWSRSIMASLIILPIGGITDSTLVIAVIAASKASLLVTSTDLIHKDDPLCETRRIRRLQPTPLDSGWLGQYTARPCRASTVQLRCPDLPSCRRGRKSCRHRTRSRRQEVGLLSEHL
ncbi:hypothetical protein EJ03DRAFT_369599 [Teratosphaeria nubilosa]|uniref:Uncharacterized protein n=1 Tax=Teratosphaeria nubilosa TaxID=161662 RepID=A0A6G1LH32_9PEZI|nr:hypothetical protein EJ03DRAFT_369599 [Teratosphaeria nubilosa]